MVTSDATPKKGAVKYGITITAPSPFAKLLHYGAKSAPAKRGNARSIFAAPPS